MNQAFRIAVLTLSLGFGGSLALQAQCPTLKWSDEFDGTSLDLANWSYDVNTDCGTPPCSWYNEELQQYYPENAAVAGGELTITATKAPAGAKWAYNSARIITQGKQAFTYGRMEARIKVPAGGGLWPAFWTLSDQQPYGVWPLSGEIDIMEWVGNEPERLLGTIHYGKTPGRSVFHSNDIRKSKGQAWSDDYHVYAVEWRADTIQWLVDDVLYATETRQSVAPERWIFDQDQFLILNLAVGGTLGGPVAPGIFPAEMKVDYVRVYEIGRPYLTGPVTVKDASQVAVYTVGQVATGTAVTWTVPAGATIVSGQGTTSLTVRWSGNGGEIKASFSGSCGPQVIAVDVSVDAGQQRARSFENFDEPSLLTVAFASGALTEVANPAKDATNGSDLVGRYARNGSQQYDVLVYNLPNLPNSSALVAGTESFSMDVYTGAKVGTEIILQLETAASSGNYPAGRQSRYTAKTTKKNAWERLRFSFVDRPDVNASPTALRTMVILFSPNSNTSDVWHFDNLDLYSVTPTSLSNLLVPVGALRLSPNPASTNLTMELDLQDAQTLTLELIDNAGRVVSRLSPKLYPAGASRETIDVAELASGSYQAVVRSAGRQSSVGFVKE